MKKTVAWMGGSRPKKLSEISAEERLTVRESFRWHCKTFFDHWGTCRRMLPSVFGDGRDMTHTLRIEERMNNF